MMDYNWILIGEVVATQGNKGEIRVFPHTDFPERFETMDEVFLFHRSSDDPDLKLELENSRLHKGFAILKLKSVDTINDALKFKGMEIKVARDQVVPLPPGSNYIFDLIGLTVETSEGLLVGKISDVLKTGANDVYVIQANPEITQNQEILIPVIDDVVLEIDITRGRVMINLLDGLLD